MRLAAQVQARTQQQAAAKGQSRYVLGNTHASESISPFNRSASACRNDLRGSRTNPSFPGRKASIAMRRVGYSLLLLATASVAGEPTFDVVWREVAQVRSNAPGASPKVQPVVANSPPAAGNVRVNRVIVAPAIIHAQVGRPVCISGLDIAAFTDTGQRARAVPLTIDMQQNHLRKLSLDRKADDLCFRPSQSGEYAIRFSSKLPAEDGTLRGAQVFVRVGQGA